MRQVTESDIPQLVVIELLTQIAPWSDEIFKRCLAAGYDCWGIDQDNKLVGFIMMSSAISGESHVLNLCVDPAYQRNGFGQALLKYALSQAKEKGMRTIFLEVRCGNQPAILLYQKMGFVQISERKNYYPTLQGREDALVFAKEIEVE